jgi:Carboxypeptidase regulatory-like domain
VSAHYGRVDTVRLLVASRSGGSEELNHASTGTVLMRQSVFVTAVVIAAIALSADICLAQVSGDGSIRGYVKDEQGGVLPGVNVTATSASAPLPYSAVSDDTGYYRIDAMLPGTYMVRVQLDGFSTYRREGVEMRAGLNLSLDIAMAIGAIKDTVTVTAGAPMLESRNATQAINVTGAFQAALPTSAAADWSDVLLLAPGVVSSQRNTGFESFYVYGTQIGAHVIQMDGVDVGAIVQGSTNYVFIGANSLQDTQVKLTGVEASAPLGTGAVINMVTKSGTNRLTGSLALSGRTRRWTGANVPGGTSGKADQILPEAAIGGPILRDRAWYFGSYRNVRSSTDAVRTAPQLVDLRSVFPDGELPSSRSTSSQLLVKGSWSVRPGHMIEGSLLSGDYYDRFAHRLATAVTGASVNGGQALSGQWRGALTDRFTARVAVGYNNNRNEGRVDAVDHPRREVYRTVTLSSGRLNGNTVLGWLDSSSTTVDTSFDYKTTVTLDATYLLSNRSGHHELQTGLLGLGGRQGWRPRAANNDGFVAEHLVLRDPSNPTLGFVPFRRQFIDVNSIDVNSHKRITNWAWYLQDTWTPRPWLTAYAGLRVDVIKQRDVIADVAIKDATAIGPRLGITAMLTSDGKNVARATWGRIHSNQTESGGNILGRNTPASVDLYDLDRDGVFETRFETPAATTFLNRTVDLSNYRQPYVAEWTAGYQRQFPGRATLDVGIVRRAFRDDPITVETNRIYDGNRFVGLHDESINERLELTSNVWNWRKYTAVTLTGTKRTQDVELIASYTRQFQRLEGTWQPDDVSSFLQPTAFPNSRGLSVTGARAVIPHVIAAGATYVTPWRFTVATNLNVHAGEWSGPITMQIPTPDPTFGAPTITLSNGRVVSNPLATTTRFAYATRGDGQLTGQWEPEWNVRIGRNVALGGARLNAAVDVLNVINSGRARGVATSSMANANFGQYAATLLPPRTFVVSVRAEF